MVAETLPVVRGVEPWCLDGLLRSHAEDGDVENDLQRLLVLAVAARAAERQERLAVAQHDGGAQRRARALSRPQDVRVLLVQDKGLHAIAERHACVARDERAAREPGRGWRGRKEVATGVGDIDRRRVERPRGRRIVSW